MRVQPVWALFPRARPSMRCCIEVSSVTMAWYCVAGRVWLAFRATGQPFVGDNRADPKEKNERMGGRHEPGFMGGVEVEFRAASSGTQGVR